MHLLPSRLSSPCSLSVRINRLIHFANIEQSPACCQRQNPELLKLWFFGGRERTANRRCRFAHHQLWLEYYSIWICFRRILNSLQ
jgi:hypothetical protein